MKTTTEAHKIALNSLITIGKEQGYLTYSEINDLLPEDLLTPEQVEPIVTILEELDIVVADEAPDADTLVMQEGGKAEANSAEVAVAALAALDSEFGRTTDPVRMYMREMGVVELLEQSDEVRIAKEIEAGVYQIMQAISLYPEEIQKVHPAMKSFNLKLASSVDVIAYHNKAMVILDNSQ